jgi:hypothetical protein
MIYFIGNGLGQVKIGYSRQPLKRLTDLQTASPTELELLAIMPGDTTTEKEYHEKYKSFKLNGEWFRLEGQIEIEIYAIRKVYKLPPTEKDLILYKESFIAWDRETSKVDDKYDGLIDAIEYKIEELESQIDALNKKRDEELEIIESQYPFFVG